MGDEMKLPRTQYNQEVRKESVKFLKESRLTLLEAAKRLLLSKGALKTGFTHHRKFKIRQRAILNSSSSITDSAYHITALHK